MSESKRKCLTVGQIEGCPKKSILLVSPWPEDHWQLRDILSSSDWKVEAVGSCQEALAFLQGGSTMVVITEKDLPDGNWQHILDAGALQENSVPVIVISWLADNLMWREVLNRGAYDLLAKPLEAKAVISAINSVWLRRKSQLQITVGKT